MTSDYQRLAVTRLGAVLEKHGFENVNFEEVTNGLDRLVATFTWNGRVYEIEIYADAVVMLSGKQMFEIFLKEEFGTPEIEISSFAKRLHRYLGEGEW